MIKIILPFPPSVNALFGGGSKQKRFPSKKYKAWVLSCNKLKKRNLSCVEIEYRLYFPDNRIRDSQNYLKAPVDFLVKEGVLIDDNWHVIQKETIISCGIDKENPRIEIYIVQK